jgi:hypothetical protein
MTRRRIVMGKEAKIYEKLNVEKLKSRIIRIISTEEALQDVECEVDTNDRSTVQKHIIKEEK